LFSLLAKASFGIVGVIPGHATENGRSWEHESAIDSMLV
jgi:hypothetical protein